MQEIENTFTRTLNDFVHSPGIARLLSGGLQVEEYQRVLREIYYYSREDPQIQAVATAYFRGADRDVVRDFLRHATAETGHDQLALDDMKALGVDVSSVPSEMPLPTTMALVAFPFYQIQYGNPVGYLGYLYFLEFLPTSSGGMLSESLRQCGVPDEAMSFLSEHAEVDVSHNAMMARYLDQLVRNEDDLAAVQYAIATTGKLYGEMIRGAIEDDGTLPRFTDHAAVRRLAA